MFKTHACEEMRAIAQWLIREADMEGDVAVGHLKGLHHVAKKRGANFDELKENIAGYVSRSHTKMSKTLSRNEVSYQQEPLTVEDWEAQRLHKEDTQLKEKTDSPLIYPEPKDKKKKWKNLQVTISGDEYRSVSSEAEQTDSE